MNDYESSYIEFDCNRPKRKIEYLKIADLLLKKFKLSCKTTTKVLLAENLSKWTISTVSSISTIMLTKKGCRDRTNWLLGCAAAALTYVADTHYPKDISMRGDRGAAIEKNFQIFLNECDLIFDFLTETIETKAETTRQTYISSWAVSLTR